MYNYVGASTTIGGTKMIFNLKKKLSSLAEIESNVIIRPHMYDKTG